MALFSDHMRAGADADTALKSRPPASQRVAQTMPYAVCVRLVGGWIAALAMLLVVVLTIRWYS